MKVQVHATVIEGYSDKPTGKLSQDVTLAYDLPGIPNKGDYIGTGYGDHPVEWVSWDRDGTVSVTLRTIYTLSDSQEDVLAALASAERVVDSAQ